MFVSYAEKERMKRSMNAFESRKNHKFGWSYKDRFYAKVWESLLINNFRMRSIIMMNGNMRKLKI